MPAEQLNATRIRIARETNLGNGVATGGWRDLPVTGAAMERELVATAERRTLYGQLSQREVISDAWTFRTSHEANLALLRWLLEANMVLASAGVWLLDPESHGASYTVETTSEGGDIAQYSGVKLTELQIFWEERRVVQIEAQWAALTRVELGSPAAGTTGAILAGPMLPTRLATMAATTGFWAGDPRADNYVLTHGGQIVLTRNIEPRNFGPDGKPDTFNQAPWTVLAEIYLPETPGVTDVAFADEWVGRLAFWLGSGTEHLRINRVHGVVTDEDLKAYDWRVRRLTVEGLVDDSRSNLEFRA